MSMLNYQIQTKVEIHQQRWPPNSESAKAILNRSPPIMHWPRKNAIRWSDLFDGHSSVWRNRWSFCDQHNQRKKQQQGCFSRGQFTTLIHGKIFAFWKNNCNYVHRLTLKCQVRFCREEWSMVKATDQKDLGAYIKKKKHGIIFYSEAIYMKNHEDSGIRGNGHEA